MAKPTRTFNPFQTLSVVFSGLKRDINNIMAMFDPDAALSDGSAGGVGAENLQDDVATTADLTTHAALATGVHGVGVSTVESAGGSQGKVDTHAVLATGIHGVGASTVESVVGSQGKTDTHGALTTGTHGVGASTIESAAGSQGKVDTHAALTTGVHGVGGSTVESVTGSQGKVDIHAALTTVHGAVSAATADRILIRDVAGRAKVVAPAAEDDIALKSNVTTVQTNLDAEMHATTGHGHTAAAGDAPKITSSGLGAGAADDTTVGNRTADPTIAAAYGLTGTLTQHLGWIDKAIKTMKGAPTNWYDLAEDNNLIPSSYGLMTVDTDSNGVVDGFTKNDYHGTSVYVLDAGQKITLAAVTVADGYGGVISTASFVVSPSTVYAYSIDAALIQSGTEMVELTIWWYTAGDVFISTSDGPLVNPGTSYAKQTLSVTSPATAGKAKILALVWAQAIGATGVAHFKNAFFTDGNLTTHANLTTGMHGFLSGSVVWDPGNLADGAGETSADITLTGAALGDYAIPAAPYDLQGITATAYVQAAGVAKIRIQNETGGAIDLASGTWKVQVIKG